MKEKVISLIQGFLKKYPIIDLGQENPNSISRKISQTLIEQCDGLVALDAGCREGIQTNALKKKGYKVTSVDVEILFPKAKFVDLNKPLPFPDKSFDLIYCSEVIEHLINPDFSVKEFDRVLKPSGKMIITTPNSYCLIFKVLSVSGFPPKAIQKKDHIHFFSKEDIFRLFPSSSICGYFPFLIKFKMTRMVSLFSPCFIIEAKKDIG
jgi:2-polyprenyl-3-methyl-5-hydroxy-6-metoxy-1,4-benzoquinol methylase